MYRVQGLFVSFSLGILFVGVKPAHKLRTLFRKPWTLYKKQDVTRKNETSNTHPNT